MSYLIKLKLNYKKKHKKIFIYRYKAPFGMTDK